MNGCLSFCLLQVQDFGVLVQRFKADLHTCVECIQDPKRLKDNIRELYKCYVQPSDVVSSRHWGYYSHLGLFWPPVKRACVVFVCRWRKWRCTQICRGKTADRGSTMRRSSLLWRTRLAEMQVSSRPTIRSSWRWEEQKTTVCNWCGNEYLQSDTCQSCRSTSTYRNTIPHSDIVLHTVPRLVQYVRPQSGPPDSPSNQNVIYLDLCCHIKLNFKLNYFQFLFVWKFSHLPSVSRTT